MNDHPLHGVRVLVSGAGIAGPALAYWLSRYGAEVTVVEIAPALRRSGFAVDFRGPTHLGVLEKMGVLDELKAAATNGGAMSAVTEDGREIFRLPEAFAGGDVEVLRRDLSRVLHERSAGRAEYRFGDAITGLTPVGDQVRADFGAAASATFDLVVGTDGLHSAVRGLAFGPESRYVRHLGFYLAGWDLPNDLRAGPTPQQYNVPGRMASVRSDPGDPGRALAFAVFAGPRQRLRLAATRASRSGSSRTRWAGWAGTCRTCSAPCAMRPNCTSTRSAGCACRAGPRAGSRCWATPPGGSRSAGWAWAPAWSARTCSPANWRAAAAITWPGSPPTNVACAATPAAGSAAPTPASSWRRPRATRLRLRNTMFASRLFQRLLVASTKSLATDAGLPDYPAACAVADF